MFYIQRVINMVPHFVIIQLIAESLPISSSGHVVLAELITAHKVPISLEILHLPSLLIILFFFRKSWLSLVRGLFSSTPSSRMRLLRSGLRIAGLAALACVPTALLFAIIKVGMRDAWWQNDPRALLVGLCATLIILASSRFAARSGNVLSSRSALAIGFVQGLALLPGISRLGSTYVAGRWLGLQPRRSFQFSMLLSLVVMAAGFAKDIVPFVQSGHWRLLASSAVMLAIVLGSLGGWLGLAVSWRLALKEKFWWFAFYMMLPIVVLGCLLVAK